MKIKLRLSVSLILFLSLSLGMAPRQSVSNTRIKSQEVIIRSVVEEFIQRIESSYAFKDLDVFKGLLDRKFKNKSRFEGVLSEYFTSVRQVHAHFIIDMVISDRDRLIVKAHWFKKATTNSGVALQFQGSTYFEFIRRVEGLKILKIKGENPFC